LINLLCKDGLYEVKEFKWAAAMYRAPDRRGVRALVNE
jgi:hypothetical protein